MRAFRTIVVWAAAVATATVATGQPAKGQVGVSAPRPGNPALVGLTVVGAHVPERGFIDDVTATDGSRLAVIVTDGATLVEARVLDAEGTVAATVPLGAIAPTVRRLYLLGARLFVVADADGPAAGALVGFDGMVIKKHAAATELFVRKVDGKDAVIAYARAPGPKQVVVHKVQALDLVKGKPLAKRTGQISVGADGRDAKLDFKLAYFVDDMTVAFGLKGGVWKKALDMRTPDSSAAYDLLSRRWLRDEAITDVPAHARGREIMASVPGQRAFVRMRDDHTGLELWRDGAASALTLDQPLALYDPGSVAFAWRDDRLWLSLKVDPVNPPAVARKKADPEYLDLFEVDGGRATRRARILAPKQKLRWGFAGDSLWVMEKNVGFVRGSKSVAFFRIDARV